MAAGPSADELHDLTCFGAMYAYAAKASADKAATVETLRMSTMFFAGKLLARHPGRNVHSQLEQNKVAIQAGLTKFDGNSCLREAAAALKPAGVN